MPSVLPGDVRRYRHPGDPRVIEAPNLNILYAAAADPSYRAFILGQQATRRAIGRSPAATDLDALVDVIPAGQAPTAYRAQFRDAAREINIMMPHYKMRCLGPMLLNMAKFHHRLTDAIKIRAVLGRGIIDREEHDHDEAFTNISLDGRHGTGWTAPDGARHFVGPGQLFHFREGFQHFSPAASPKFTLVMFGDH